METAEATASEVPPNRMFRRSILGLLVIVRSLDSDESVHCAVMRSTSGRVHFFSKNSFFGA